MLHDTTGAAGEPELHRTSAAGASAPAAGRRGLGRAAIRYPAAVVRNGQLAEALFSLAESHPPGELRLALVRAAYAVFDCPRELATVTRVPDTIPLEALPTVAMLRAARGEDALQAAVQRLRGPLLPRGTPTREGFLTAAEVGELLGLGAPLDPRHLRGACHFHTQASDGTTSLEAMARAALRRGASWAVVTDHTRGLACVNGLDAEGVALQRQRIASWNRRRGDELWLVQGLEAEILPDGTLDVPRRARDGVLLVAAIHTELGDRRDQTARLVRALAEPGVWALAHPQGRLFSRRSGLRANWEVVFREAAGRDVLLEINGFPRRQDLGPSLLAVAVATGCRFLLASDAHHPRHLSFDATAVAMASLARVPEARIVNFQMVETALANRLVG